MVLDVIGVESSSFKEIVTIIRELPCFKLFRGGMINELKVSITYQYGKTINNNDQQINIVIQITKHEHSYREVTTITINVDVYDKTTYVDSIAVNKMAKRGDTMTGRLDMAGTIHIDAMSGAQSKGGNKITCW